MSIITRTIQVGASNDVFDFAQQLSLKLRESGFEVLSESCLTAFANTIYSQ